MRDFRNIASLELTSIILVFAVPTRSVAALSKVTGMVRLIAARAHGGGSLSSVGDDRPPGSSLLTVPSYVEATVERLSSRTVVNERPSGRLGSAEPIDICMHADTLVVENEVRSTEMQQSGHGDYEVGKV